MALGFYALAQHPQFSWLADQFEHASWEGLTFWDLIQPAFMFMVGVAMPFSFARRTSERDSHWRRLRHVVRRSLMLILLSQILISVSDNRLSFQMINSAKDFLEALIVSTTATGVQHACSGL
jgi:predicted acyltransferase